MRGSLVLSWLALLAVVLLAYGGVLSNGYVWDDVFFLSENEVVADFGQVLRIITEPLFGQRSYFRPLPLLAIYTESLLSGRNPSVSHAVNLAIHLANCTLVLLIVRRAMVDMKVEGRVAWLVPLLLALVYGVHPALSEAVIWVSSRFDLMATLFILLAIWVWGMDGLRTLPRALLVTVIFFLGALCKETLVALPVVLVAYQLLRQAARAGVVRFEIAAVLVPRHVAAFAGVILAGLVYLFLRHQALEGAEALAPRQYPWHLRLMLPFLSAGQYIRLTLVPFIGISPHHTFYWSGIQGLLPYLPWAVAALVLLVTACISLVRRRLYGLVVAAWFAALFPVLHVVPLTIGDNLIHERFMYFPVAVLVLLLPYVARRLPVSDAMARLGTVLLVLFVLASVPLVRSIVPMWRSDAVLWEWAVQMDPNSREAKGNLIWTYADQGRYGEVITAYEEMKTSGAEINPATAINMGAVYYFIGNYEASLEAYELALTYRSVLPPSYRSNLYASVALVHALLGHDQDARGFIGMALREKTVTVNAVANYLAFCRGRAAESMQFNAAQYRSAIGPMKASIASLVVNQREMYEAGRFCPDVMGMPLPAS